MSVENRLSNIEDRVRVLENSVSNEQVHREHITKQLEKINANTVWAIRLVIGAIIAAIVAFGLNGGFVP